jgi:hypothetical protein
MPIEPPKIFISHSWDNKSLVRRLEAELKAAGAEVWVDHAGVRGGENLPKEISAALAWCNTVILVWSQSAAQSRSLKKHSDRYETSTREFRNSSVRTFAKVMNVCSDAFRRSNFAGSPTSKGKTTNLFS